MIELSELIAELRGELSKAITAAPDEGLQLDLGPIELEATVAVERQTDGGAKVRFYVLEVGADAKASRSATQRIKLMLQPRLAGSDATPYVSGDEIAGGER